MSTKPKNTKIALPLAEGAYEKKPTLKNMLWLQIERLSDSTDPADIQLRDFLQAEFRRKKYKRENIKDSTANLIFAVVETGDLSASRGISISSAANIVAKKWGISAKTIMNGVTKYKYKPNLS